MSHGPLTFTAPAPARGIDAQTLEQWATQVRGQAGDATTSAFADGIAYAARLLRDFPTVQVFSRCELGVRHDAHLVADLGSLTSCPGQSADCPNCDDRHCMDCVLRYVHDRCAHTCPTCGPGADQRAHTATRTTARTVTAHS